MGARQGVLFIHSATQPPLGADVWVHALLMRHLDRSRYDVHAACVRGSGSEPTPTFKALSAIPDMSLLEVDLGPELFQKSRKEKALSVLKTIPALASFAKLVRYVRHHRIGIVHTSDRPRDAAICALLAKVTGAKCVIQVHVEYGTWMSPMLRWAMRNADALIGVSRFVQRSLVIGGYPESKTHAVLNAIDVDAWDPTLEGSATRAELGISPSAQVVLVVARLYRAKGQDQLVRAIASLKDRAPDARLVIVGQDYPVGTHFSSELRALAEELGVADKISLTGQRSDIARLLSACDVFAMPSIREPFGLVYAEAMAMGRPVVALNDGGTPEVVEHGGSGLLSAEGDARALAANLLELIKDAGTRRRMGEYARRTVETKFAPGRMAREMERIYSTL